MLVADRFDDFEVPRAPITVSPVVRSHPNGAMLVALIAHYAIVHAQSPDQLTVYSPQTSYSVPLLDQEGQPYAGLVELLEPLGSIDAKPDGKKYKLRFTRRVARQVEAQFNDGKDKSQGSRRKLQAAGELRSAEWPGLRPAQLGSRATNQAAGNTGSTASFGAAPVHRRRAHALHSGAGQGQSAEADGQLSQSR